MTAPRHAVIAIVLAALALAGCEAETAPLEEPASRPVQVASVVFTDDVVSRDFVGVIAPRTETDLAFRVGGTLNVNPGQATGVYTGSFSVQINYQ